MKKIPLGKKVGGLFTLVDDKDYPGLSNNKWHGLRNTVLNTGDFFYAARREPTKVNKSRPYIFLHKVLMGKKEGFIIDHINGNSLDNRRSNLRFVSHGDNIRNSGPRKGKRFKGVQFRAGSKNPWSAHVTPRNEHSKYVGSFSTEDDAAHAYDQAMMALGYETAWLNFTTKNQNQGARRGGFQKNRV